MRSQILAILGTCSLAFAAATALCGETVTGADLPKLIADAAKYQSGQSAEPIQKIEQLLRDSAGKPALRPNSKLRW